RLQRSLYLALQVLELGAPVVVALNMVDEARTEGRVPDTAALAAAVGVPVVPIVARTGEGTVALRQAIAAALDAPEAVSPGSPHRFSDALLRDADELAPHLPPALAASAGASQARQRALAMWLLLS